MDKLKMESIDMTQKNIDKIGALFPNVITEMRDEDGKLKKGIDFELLKQELSGDVVDSEECYDFTWVGKKAAIVEGNTPIRKTLRPYISESKAWETTGNLYIEGDNLDVLKLLQESYLNSIKMIYIDPPYNTGNDFIYKDNFSMNKNEYNEQIGIYDENENRLFQNSENNGRFHSDWCSMLYPRLKLAQNLLSEDGVLFISIGNEEVENAKKICNEVFGELNFKNSIIIRRGAKNLQAQFETIDSLNSGYEYVLMYSKSTDSRFQKLYRESDEEPIGAWNNHWRGTDRPTMRYEIFGIKPEKGQWRWAEQRSIEAIKNYEEMIIEIGVEKPTQEQIDLWYLKKVKELNVNRIDLLRLSNNGKPEHYIAPSNKKLLNDLWDDIKPNGSTYTSQLFGDKVFDNPKSVDLIIRLIEFIANKENDIILDFFAGSSTTAHAVMQLNSADGGNRKFIMVQLPEVCDEKSDAYKSGYSNICEIGKERIRRAGEKINEEIIKNNVQLKIEEEAVPLVDIGFRVLKVDSTNMKDVYYSANEYNQDMLAGLESNIKEDRTDLDLLYGVLLDWGLPLSLSHKIEEIEGVTVHTVDDGSLVACFAKDISENIVREIAKIQPLRVVFQDSSFISSPDKINVDEIFKLLAPNTTVKVI